MGVMIEGRWRGDRNDFPRENGRFVRQASGFRNWITPDGAPGPSGEGGFGAEAGRYHLYVSLACPWACRTLILRKLKGLEDAITVSVVEPKMGDEGWVFGEGPGATKDTVNGFDRLHEVYAKADPDYTGRVVVPVLWDKQQETIVNNESSEIIRMLNGAFGAAAPGTLFIDMSTVSPDISAKVGARANELGLGYLRAPGSGGVRTLAMLRNPVMPM